MSTREVFCPVCYISLGTIVGSDIAGPEAAAQSVERLSTIVEQGHINKEHRP